MSKEYTLVQDLKEAQAFVDSLDSYLKGDQVYGTVGGGWFTGRRMPALTIGSLAMRLRRLHALEDRLTPQQRSQLDQIEAKHAAIRKQWRAHYQQKLEREIKSRLDAMRPFFEEAQSDPNLASRVYGPEILRRTIAEEALIALDDLGIDTADLARKAKTVDSMLRRYVAPSSFAWDRQLEPVYPQSRFWWMYVAPPVATKA